MLVWKELAVSGIANGASIAITGGEYSIGCTATFTNAAGSINNNDTVCVRQTSASSCGITTTATVTIAGFPVKTFNVTTGSLYCDTTPNAFSFLAQVNAALGATLTSNTVTIAGINSPASVGIAGGEYSIGCTATFVSTPGTISNNQTLCVFIPNPATCATGALRRRW